MPKCALKTRYIPATFAWTLLLGATTAFFYFPCQYYIFRYPWVPAYQGVITFFVLANFTLATFMDPGIIPKAPPDEDIEDDFRAPLYKNVDINDITVRMKWCVTCKFYRPPRCSHCSVCNHCIETFDHHCPWVNNCIGRRNYRFFFFFLISLSVHMISVFTLSLIFVLNNKDKIPQKETIVSMVLMGIVVLLAIPIFGLTGFHMVLVSRGRTTNEQVTGKFKGGYNPFSRGCWQNCCYTQCGPQYPSLVKAAKISSKKATITKVTNVNAGGGAISTITSDNQVKTYMDNSNGGRNISSNAYNKLSPGRADDIDADMEPGASQSADCEPTPPPLQRHGSKNNFLLASGNSGSAMIGGNIVNTNGAIDQYYHVKTGEATSPPQMIGAHRSVVGGGAHMTQSAGHRPSPTMQQRVKALGVATPLAMSSPIRRSNPGTPTQPRRPDFISVSNSGATHFPVSGANLMTSHPLAQYSTTATAHHYVPQAKVTQVPVATSYAIGGSPQRRFLSEGELVRDEPMELSYPPPRTNNTVDNIRELAGSPQRGVYMWKDTSPSGQGMPIVSTSYAGAYNPYQRNVGPPPQQQQQPPATKMPSNTSHYDYYCSNPTSPTATTTAPGAVPPSQMVPRTYHPALRGGVAVLPTSVNPSQSTMPPYHHHAHIPGNSPQQTRRKQLPQVGGGASNNVAPVVTTSSDQRRRPMSFVRALEMSNSMDMPNLSPSHHFKGKTQAGGGSGVNASPEQTPDRTSVYDMNYEISV